MLFQTQDKLAFHIGAKHKEVDLILEQKGIPIPQERVLLAENVETRQTTSVESEPRTSASVLSPPGSENAATPGSKDGNPPENPQSAAARTCAGVNYDLQCQVRDLYLFSFNLILFVCAGLPRIFFFNPPSADPALHTPFHQEHPGLALLRKKSL